MAWSCRMNETCIQGYQNEQSAQLSGAYMYMYTKLQTMTCPLVSQMTNFTLSEFTALSL
jgi:hypothetical protein